MCQLGFKNMSLVAFLFIISCCLVVIISYFLHFCILVSIFCPFVIFSSKILEEWCFIF